VQHITLRRPFVLGQFEDTVSQWSAFAKDRSYRTEAEREVGEKECFAWADPDDEGKCCLGSLGAEHRIGETAEHWLACSKNQDVWKYLTYASSRTDKRCCRPREAEPEHAARFGRAACYPWGDDIAQSRVCYDLCAGQWNGELCGWVDDCGKNSCAGTGLRDAGLSITKGKP